MMQEPVAELILKMADDALVLGHRHSEWTGLGPILEEDISMSSMAQDKVGHALALYTILHEHFQEPEPDRLAFRRPAKDFRNCHLVEQPNGAYDFTLVRHFLYDHAEFLRYELLTASTFEPLAHLARKIRGELKYHLFHANTWFSRLAHGTEESHDRLQAALEAAYPLAYGIFEKSPFEKELIGSGVFAGEEHLREKWESAIQASVQQAHLFLPAGFDRASGLGGRNGHHTPWLEPLLAEMAGVIHLEADTAEW